MYTIIKIICLCWGSKLTKVEIFSLSVFVGQRKLNHVNQNSSWKRPFWSHTSLSTSTIDLNGFICLNTTFCATIRSFGNCIRMCNGTLRVLFDFERRKKHIITMTWARYVKTWFLLFVEIDIYAAWNGFTWDIHANDILTLGTWHLVKWKRVLLMIVLVQTRSHQICQIKFHCFWINIII